MIPMACGGRPARLMTAKEVEDGYGVVREWVQSARIFATITPISKTQVPAQDGIEPDMRFRISFCLPPGRRASQDDRIECDGDTYRLMTVVDYRGSIIAEGVMQ